MSTLDIPMKYGVWWTPIECPYTNADLMPSVDWPWRKSAKIGLYS
jgi:hypothetical protein